MLDEGTRTRNALGIADEPARLGDAADGLGDGSDSDVGDVARPQFAGALELVADVAFHPTFRRRKSSGSGRAASPTSSP